MKPSVETIRNTFSYDSQTGILARVKATRSDFIGKETGKIEVMIDNQKYSTSHVIWAHVFGYWPEFFIDHINGDRTDNRLANLREATATENQYNKRGFGQFPKGVVFKADANRSKPWSARIRIAGKKVAIGSYETMEEAAEAYQKKAEEIQSSFALHNSRR